jgi:hypothetical protein
MTQADSVHSTPPTSTSARLSRRSILGAIAGSAAAAGGIAGLTPVISSALPADPAFALIAAHRAAEVGLNEAVDVQSAAETKYGVRSAETWEARDRCAAMCDEVNAIAWKLATTPPTTLAGIAAVLRFANEVEDVGGDWPDTDTIGPDGWHYQLRATMAAAIEALVKARAGKAVQA